MKKKDVSHFAFGRLIDIDTCTALLLCHYYDYRFFIISNNALQAFSFPIRASIIYKNEFARGDGTSQNSEAPNSHF